MSKMNYIRSVSPFYNAAASVAEGGGLAGGLMGSGRAAQSAPTIKGGYFPQTERLVQRPWYMGGGTELVPVPELEQQEHYADWQNRNPSAFYNTGGTVRQGGRDYTVWNGRVIDDEGQVITGPKARNILARAKSNYTEERKAADEARGKHNQEKAKAFAGGVAKMGAGLLPGLGEAMDAGDLYNAARAGDWTGAAISAGALGLGLVPGLGDAAASGLRTIGRGAKNADLLATAARHGDADYFDAWKMAARGNEPAARSAGASARFGDFDINRGRHMRDMDKPERVLGVEMPDDAALRRQYKDASQAIGADAARIRAGEPEVTSPSTIWENAQPEKWSGTHTKKQPTQDLVRWTRPSESVWTEQFPNVPYPKEDPLVLVNTPMHQTTPSAMSGTLKTHGRNIDARLRPQESMAQWAARTTPASGPAAPTAWSDIQMDVEPERLARPGTLEELYKQVDTGIHGPPQAAAKTLDNMAPDEYQRLVRDNAAGHKSKQQLADDYGLSTKMIDNLRKAQRPPVISTASTRAAKEAEEAAKLSRANAPLSASPVKQTARLDPQTGAKLPPNWDNMKAGERARWKSEQLRKKHKPRRR